MITKSEKDFECFGQTASDESLVIDPCYIGENDSGWVIEGDICEDWYSWVNSFKARKPGYGWVRGNFDCEVEASSERAYKDFIKYHAPHVFCYGDI